MKTQLSIRKRILLFAILLSLTPVAFYVDFSRLGNNLGWLPVIARVAGILGTILMFWEYLLAARWFIPRWVVDYMWLNRLHKWFGKYGFFLLLIHPLFLIIYYADSWGINLIKFTFNSTFDVYHNTGTIAMVLLLITVLASIYLRKKLKFDVWHKLHLLTYLVLPLALLHNIGISQPGAFSARSFWIILAAIYIVVLVGQILFSYGVFKAQYLIARVDAEANKVINIHLRPTNWDIAPQPGQFVYLQRPENPELHPFSVCDYDPANQIITFSTKALGEFSTKLSKLKKDDLIFLDGPYGTFTFEAFTTNRPLVFIAGGIGMVPFMPTIYMLKRGLEKNITVFYGNNAEQDIAFIDELADVAQSVKGRLQIVHVVRDGSKDPGHEIGFINLEIIRKYLNQPLNSYEYFVCGPPVMINKVEDELAQAGVKRDQMHHELFSF